MKLTLDHTERLNLQALLGAQRASIRIFERSEVLEGKIALGADEETALTDTREVTNDLERVE